MRGASEVRTARDQCPRDDLRLDDLALVVDVGDEVVERSDALREATLDLGPLVGGDDPRHQVEREWPVADSALGGRQVEGDSLAHEQRVTQLPGRNEALAAEPLELRHQRLRVLATGPVLREDLVVAARHLSAGAHPHILDHGGQPEGCQSGQDRRVVVVRGGNGGLVPGSRRGFLAGRCAGEDI